jgi:putative transposase
LRVLSLSKKKLDEAKFTQEQIIGLLKQHEASVSTAQLCRDNNLSAASFYKWKAKYGSMSVDDSKRLKQLEDEISHSAAGARVYLARGAIDMRKSTDGYRRS